MWAHCDCVNISNDDVVNLWSCFSCRCLPENNKKISEQMSKLDKSLNELKQLNANLVNIVTERRQEISDLGSRLGSLINNTNEGFILVSNRKQGNAGSGGATPSISPPSRSNNLPYPIYPAARHAKTVQHPKQTVTHQSPFCTRPHVCCSGSVWVD